MLNSGFTLFSFVEENLLNIAAYNAISELPTDEVR